MKFALLTRNPNLYSHKRLQDVAQERGHTMVCIDYMKCALTLSSLAGQIHYDTINLKNFDYFIPRIAASKTFYGLTVLRQLEMLKIPTLNSASAIARSRDKFHCLQILAHHGIPFPKTAFCHDRTQIDLLLQKIPQTPVIIKLLEGTQGLGVMLGETKKSAKAIVEAFRKAKIYVLLQDFITESQGKDVRAFVVGGKVIAAMERQGPCGEFRSNLHRGGSARQAELTDDEEEMALQAAQAIGLEICGVDLLRSSTGPVVMEINSSPGLEGIERATGVDIASAIIAVMERTQAHTLQGP